MLPQVLRTQIISNKYVCKISSPNLSLLKDIQWGKKTSGARSSYQNTKNSRKKQVIFANGLTSKCECLASWGNFLHCLSFSCYSLLLVCRYQKTE